MNVINRIQKPSLATTITSSTAETTISPAVVAGTYLDLYRLVISNSSATGTLVSIRSVTAGTILANFWVAGGSVVGFSGTSDDALPQVSGGMATLWTAQCSVSVASVYINAEFKRNVG